MQDVYRHVASRVGTSEAQSFAVELSAWHDAMVKHRRRVAQGRAPERDGAGDGPAAEARELWQRAVDVFGPHAGELEFLRHTAEGA